MRPLSVHRSSIEPLETRNHFSTTFTVNSSLSSVTFSARLYNTSNGSNNPFLAQTPTLSSNATTTSSLTAQIGGSLTADFTGSSLSIASSSAVPIINNGNWLPGNNVGSAGNNSVIAPANFAAYVDTGIFGHENFAARGAVFTPSSSAIPVSVGGTFDPDQVELDASAGTLLYDGIAPGAFDMRALQGPNQVVGTASLLTSGNTETLTLPLFQTHTEAVADFSPSLALAFPGYNVDISFTGNLVATATAPEPVAAAAIGLVGLTMMRRRKAKAKGAVAAAPFSQQKID